MNVQQLRCICEVARQDLNVSKAAETLNTSQPGVSTQIRQLEEELGFAIFVRQRSRLVAISSDGALVIERAQRALMEIDDIRQLGRAHRTDENGTLAIAASHTQARFRLPTVLSTFTREYPKVQITIRPESGKAILDAIITGRADIGVLSTFDSLPVGLVALPFHTCRRVLLVPIGHALLDVGRPTLEDIARYPIVVFEPSNSRTTLLRELDRLQLRSPTLLQGTNADVVKAYVEHGLGVTVLPDIAFDPQRDFGLRAINVDHLFPESTTYLVLNNKHYLRPYTYAFITMLAPQLRRDIVQKACTPSNV